jgi:hypothetical protein
MVALQSIEGLIDEVCWYHYDMPNDVLYLRLASKMGAQTCAEETEDGYLLLRDMATEEVAGVTIVNWWKRFGKGALPDSLALLQRAIQPWAKKVAA